MGSEIKINLAELWAQPDYNARMLWFWLVLLILLNTLWLALVLLGLPGNWLMILSVLLFAWWQADAQIFRTFTLVLLCVLGVAGELIEFAAGTIGSRKAGGKTAGSIGAILGGITGALVGTLLLPIPVIGSLAGACGGAFLGACLGELSQGRKMEASIKSGVGAGAGPQHIPPRPSPRTIGTNIANGSSRERLDVSC